MARNFFSTISRPSLRWELGVGLMDVHESHTRTRAFWRQSRVWLSLPGHRNRNEVICVTEDRYHIIYAILFYEMNGCTRTHTKYDYVLHARFNLRRCVNFHTVFPSSWVFVYNPLPGDGHFSRSRYLYTEEEEEEEPVGNSGTLYNWWR